MNNAEENNVKWIMVVVVLLGEAILISFILVFFYPMVTMLLFGEAPGSFLYSKFNLIVWALVPICAPTVININIIRNAFKNENPKTKKSFKLIQLILMLLYFPLIFWMYFTFVKT